MGWGSAHKKDLLHAQFRRLWLLFVLAACLSGCVSAPQIRESVKVSIQQTLTNAWHRPISGPAISFVDACARRACLDQEIIRSMIDEDGKVIDIEQASSWIWPRLMVEMGGQLPLGHNTDADVIGRGGLSLRYDFQRALFRDDAVATAKAHQQRSVEQTRLLVGVLIFDLFNDLNEIDFFRQEVELQSQRLEAARAGLTVVNYMERWDETVTETRAEWVEKVSSISWELDRAKRDLALISRRLCHSLGAEDDISITVTNAAMMLALADEGSNHTAEHCRRLEDVWVQHPAAHMAELDLFLAEMSVLDAKRERIPRVNGSVGAGRLSTWREDGETASVIFGLEVLTPLIDFGDIRRSVERASQRRSLVLEETRGLVRRLAADLDEMHARRQESKAILARSRAEHQAIKREAGAIFRLTQLGALSPLESIRHAISQCNAEVRERRAVLSWRKAWAADNRCLGNDIFPGFADQVLQAIRNEWHGGCLDKSG